MLGLALSPWTPISTAGSIITYLLETGKGVLNDLITSRLPDIGGPWVASGGNLKVNGTSRVVWDSGTQGRCYSEVVASDHKTISTVVLESETGYALNVLERDTGAVSGTNTLIDCFRVVIDENNVSLVRYVAGVSLVIDFCPHTIAVGVPSDVIITMIGADMTIDFPGGQISNTDSTGLTRTRVSLMIQTGSVTKLSGFDQVEVNDDI